MEDKKIKISITIVNEKTKTLYLFNDIHIWDFNNEISITDSISRAFDLISNISKDFKCTISIESEVKIK